MLPKRHRLTACSLNHPLRLGNKYIANLGINLFDVFAAPAILRYLLLVAILFALIALCFLHLLSPAKKDFFSCFIEMLSLKIVPWTYWYADCNEDRDPRLNLYDPEARLGGGLNVIHPLVGLYLEGYQHVLVMWDALSL